jgi:glycine cleavage system aminomethyltransferase T
MKKLSDFSLEAKIESVGNPLDMLRNASLGPYQFPIQSEFTNWRDEQEAWRKTAVLFDQSYHMTDHYIEGPDTRNFIESLAVNSCENWSRDVAKQLVFCNYDGRVVGDGIMFILEEEKVNIVNKPINRNWVQFHAETGGFNVETMTDSRALDNLGSRLNYRFEVQGPNAWSILERLNGQPLPDWKFFRMGEIRIAGRSVRALRHGMAGAVGLELFGPFEEKEEIRGAIIEAGRDMGLLAAGSKTYSTVAHESGWFPSPMPAIYSGDSMKAYREWLPGDGFEANISLGGSMVSDDIEDYYLTPYELGYGHIVNFDHDFIGRKSLKDMRGGNHRKKVTLKWHEKDVMKVFASLYSEGDRYKFLDLPASHYATLPYDLVERDGKAIGISHYPVYTANERSWISLAILEQEWTDPGTEVSVLWGEPDGGTNKPTVERHIQIRIKATVFPCPISKTAFKGYKV